jgi:hypothetical protein
MIYESLASARRNLDDDGIGGWFSLSLSLSPSHTHACSLSLACPHFFSPNESLLSLSL